MAFLAPNCPRNRPTRRFRTIRRIYIWPGRRGSSLRCGVLHGRRASGCGPCPAALTCPMGLGTIGLGFATGQVAVPFMAGFGTLHAPVQLLVPGWCIQRSRVRSTHFRGRRLYWMDSFTQSRAVEVRGPQPPFHRHCH